ncbi:DUF4407 domain-containing protein [Nocardia sp. NPDC046473]|uniref:DUF4407 domain-containing protein n=1 Tax=Nocardia sp. NPDC046473 TaxID=3155733 RepID=UPI0033C0C74C
MTTDIIDRPLVPDPIRDFDRPDLPDLNKTGRRLRSIIGIREVILDWVPEERTRYTRLGAIVFNTGLMAGLSLIVAFSGLADGRWLLLLPIGIFWGYLIMTFDGWLIASTHGVLHTSRIKLFLPRLFISILLGAVIAEPLVMWAFRPSILTEISEFRQSSIDSYESRLKTCNPADGRIIDSPDCAAFRVDIESNPMAVEQQLTSAQQLLGQSQQNLDDANRQLAEFERLAREECAGTPGPGLTGRIGEGRECSDNRDTVNKFRNDSHIDQQRDDFIKLQAKIVTLTSALSDARRQSSEQISTKISAKVAEKQQNLRDRGLLDEFDAMSRLSAKNPVISIAEWVLRLLLIAVDSLPVLSKMMGGTTTYDTLVSQRLDAARRSHGRHTQLHDLEESTSFDLRSRGIERKLRDATGRIEDQERSVKAQREAELATQIDRLAAELEHDEHEI